MTKAVVNVGDVPLRSTSTGTRFAFRARGRPTLAEYWDGEDVGGG